MCSTYHVIYTVLHTRSTYKDKLQPVNTTDCKTKQISPIELVWIGFKLYASIMIQKLINRHVWFVILCTNMDGTGSLMLNLFICYKIHEVIIVT